MSEPRILFVDDDADIHSALRLLLARRGFGLLAARSAEAATTLLGSDTVDLVLLDLNYAPGATTGAEGLALLRDIRARHPDLPVVVVTGHSGIAVAVAAMRAGAQDFVMKPWNNARLVALLQEVLARRAAPAAPADRHAETPMIAACAPMRRALDLADRLAATRASILIAGPPGSGKTTLARRIHARSGEDRAAVMLAGGDATTWPSPDAAGCWILRDIERLAPGLQSALAERFDCPSSPRVLALTALPPDMALARLDTRLRLHLDIARIVVPSLQERGDEIEALARHFLHLAASRHRRPVPEITPELCGFLRRASWPQNLRALRAAMERLVLLGETESGLIPPERPGAAAAPGAACSLAQSERALIAEALKRHGFNVSHAAAELGLSRPALYRRMARHGL